MKLYFYKYFYHLLDMIGINTNIVLLFISALNKLW